MQSASVSTTRRWQNAALGEGDVGGFEIAKAHRLVLNRTVADELGGSAVKQPR